MATTTGSGVAGHRPNVLIILPDDERIGSMSIMPVTRRIFGRGGVRFPNGYVTTPLCCPSRASIFSGRYAHNHTVQSNQPGAESEFDQAATMQGYLQGAGYRTAIFGKYFNAWDLSEDPPGFDRWAIQSPHKYAGYYGGTWNVEGRQRAISQYSTDYIAARGAAFIRSSEGDTPWFLELATFAPHMPAYAAHKYANAPVPPFTPDPSMLERDLSDKPPFLQGRHRMSIQTIRNTRTDQLRALMSVDELVRSTFRALRQTGQLRDTLAFFLSDNGLLWGAHGTLGKQTPYTTSIKVPFYMRWPGHVRAGSVDDRFVANIDIAPTVLEAAGIAPTVPMDGRPLQDRWTRDHLLFEYWRLKHPADVPTWASIRTRTVQYVEYYDDEGRITFREYYDLAADPWQLTNLLHDGDPSDDPDVGPLHRELAADRVCSGSDCP